jgi:tRNA pseudouridine55 synthase
MTCRLPEAEIGAQRIVGLNALAMARIKKGDKVDGWVILDKPVGLGSTQAVGKVRRLFGAQKAGHGGTLDPLACGDAEGEVTETSDVRPSDAEIRAVLRAFIGTIEQVPPAFSALKIDGKRAYDLARAGVAVDLKSRKVVIDRLELLGRPDAEHADFVVACGKGTYIRSLGRDLARAVGTVGHLSFLRRTAAGPFREGQAISLSKLEALGHNSRLLGALAPVATALDDIPALALTEAQASRLRQGQPLASTQDAPTSGTLYRAEQDGRLVALVRSEFSECDGTSLKPVRVFNL